MVTENVLINGKRQVIIKVWGYVAFLINWDIFIFIEYMFFNQKY
jgi:hypothetical protein